MKYVVQPGDTLSKIARDQLGDARRWPELSKLNRITNADRIIIGSQLVLPDGAKPQSTDARFHALSEDRLSAVTLGGRFGERPAARFTQFGEKRFWIDVDKAKAGGATLHETDAILKDLERISKKTKDPKFKSYIEELRNKAQSILRCNPSTMKPPSRRRYRRAQ